MYTNNEDRMTANFRCRKNGLSRIYLPEILAAQLDEELQERIHAKPSKVEAEAEKAKKPADEEETSFADPVSEESWAITPSPFVVQIFDPTEVRRALLAKQDQYDDKTRRMEKIIEAADEFEGHRKLITTPIPTIAEELNRLAINMPNFKAAIDILLSELVVAMAGQGADFHITPICLDGPPAIGKTHFAREIARILDVGFEQISLGATSGGFDLTGLSPGWATARAGKISTLLAERNSACPVVLLDEIDKMKGDTRFSSENVLLDLLERNTASYFMDEGLELRFDASKVIFLATSNNAEQMSDPLLSRMRMVEVEAPNIEQRRVIIGTIAHSFKRLEITFAADVLDALAELDIDLRSISRLARDLVGCTLIAGETEVKMRHMPARRAQKQGMGFL